LAAAAPGIFGVLNQDGSVNSVNSPAPPNTIIQIFATGLATDGGFQVTAGQSTASDKPLTVLPVLYAGGAPGLPGVQQVNATIPLAPVLSSGTPVKSPYVQLITVCSVSSSAQACGGYSVYFR